MQIPSSLDRAPAAKFEHAQRRTQDFIYLIEPAVGAGARRVVIHAETRAEADLKAMQAAKDMHERERLIQFVE